jgi:adenylate cyclase
VSGPKDKRVLIVEDEREIADFLATAVASKAAVVMVAYDGEEGLKAARQDGPDLILLDMKMPRMNGLEVVQALQERAETAGIPIIILTSTKFDPGTLALFKQLPSVKAFLPKMGSADALYAELDKHLND